ncbi:hypothetical protein F8M41_011441 [Gigaspora margarita]|uniref:Uncharacterized protein n=1 Tax=Gigaspora margarita TaxID=4874 RepID=A0A8H4ATT3_GIGMA|nr:hypothetical protein F8M41_011441 [Gigaspora margarita]
MLIAIFDLNANNNNNPKFKIILSILLPTNEYNLTQFFNGVQVLLPSSSKGGLYTTEPTRVMQNEKSTFRGLSAFNLNANSTTIGAGIDKISQILNY